MGKNRRRDANSTRRRRAWHSASRLGSSTSGASTTLRDGTWSGFEIDIIKSIAAAVTVPVIANGGAGNLKHIGEVVKEANASAVALGSMVVYQKKGLGVLVNFPDQAELKRIIG